MGFLNFLKVILVGIITSLTLLWIYQIGLYTLREQLIETNYLNLLLVLLIDFGSLYLMGKTYPESSLKLLLITFLLIILNSFFAIIIGLTLPTLKDKSADNMQYLIPLLITLNFVIVNKFNKDLQYMGIVETDVKKRVEAGENSRKTVIVYKDNVYYFSVASYIRFFTGVLSFCMLAFVGLLVTSFYTNELDWIEEITLKQASYLVDLLYGDISKVVHDTEDKYWVMHIKGRAGTHRLYSIETATPILLVMWGVIIFAPQSKDKYTNHDIMWRKAKLLIVSSVIIWCIILIKFVVLYKLYYDGGNQFFADPASVGISLLTLNLAILFYLWLPEVIFMVVIIWNKFKSKKKKRRIMKEQGPIS